MNPFQTSFSIRDLEEFTGVKAHTIRIWEKRYGLLRPERSDTNIRRYGIEELRNLLNVSYLNQHGHKISRIAAMKPEDRARTVREIGERSSDPLNAINELKMAMLKFDEAWFERISDHYIAREGFRALAEGVYLPLLEHIGLLWQTNSICPAHEHFVSNLVRRKIEAMTDAATMPPVPTDPRTFVLFLPEHEIHELGLLYANFLLRSAGRRTIYLGQSLPASDLAELLAVFTGPVVLLTFITTRPSGHETSAYVRDLTTSDPDPRISYWVAGPEVSRIEGQFAPGVSFFHRLDELTPHLI